jgi:hypothetical protein
MRARFQTPFVPGLSKCPAEPAEAAHLITPLRSAEGFGKLGPNGVATACKDA